MNINTDPPNTSSGLSMVMDESNDTWPSYEDKDWGDADEAASKRVSNASNRSSYASSSRERAAAELYASQETYVGFASVVMSTINSTGRFASANPTRQGSEIRKPKISEVSSSPREGRSRRHSSFSPRKSQVPDRDAYFDDSCRNASDGSAHKSDRNVRDSRDYSKSKSLVSARSGHQKQSLRSFSRSHHPKKNQDRQSHRSDKRELLKESLSHKDEKPRSQLRRARNRSASQRRLYVSARSSMYGKTPTLESMTPRRERRKKPNKAKVTTDIQWLPPSMQDGRTEPSDETIPRRRQNTRTIEQNSKQKPNSGVVRLQLTKALAAGGPKKVGDAPRQSLTSRGRIKSSDRALAANGKFQQAKAAQVFVPKAFISNGNTDTISSLEDRVVRMKEALRCFHRSNSKRLLEAQLGEVRTSGAKSA